MPQENQPSIFLPVQLFDRGGIRLLLTGGTNGQAVLWNARSKKQVTTLSHETDGGTPLQAIIQNIAVRIHLA